MMSSAGIRALLCAIALPFLMAAQIDTNQVIDVKFTTISGRSFRYFKSGVSGPYAVGVSGDKLYAVNKNKKVRPYLIISYDFSYTDKDYKYRTFSCTGNSIDARIPAAIAEVPQGANIYIDNIYATNVFTNSQTKIGGTTLIKP
jgi:hypothetical protein